MTGCFFVIPTYLTGGGIPPVEGQLSEAVCSGSIVCWDYGAKCGTALRVHHHDMEADAVTEGNQPLRLVLQRGGDYQAELGGRPEWGAGSRRIPLCWR
ncbi:hypothetical protein D9M71_569660 [compost metagenome]